MAVLKVIESDLLAREKPYKAVNQPTPAQTTGPVDAAQEQPNPAVRSRISRLLTQKPRTPKILKRKY